MRRADVRRWSAAAILGQLAYPPWGAPGYHARRRRALATLATVLGSWRRTQFVTLDALATMRMPIWAWWYVTYALMLRPATRNETALPSLKFSKMHYSSRFARPSCAIELCPVRDMRAYARRRWPPSHPRARTCLMSGLPPAMLRKLTTALAAARAVSPRDMPGVGMVPDDVARAGQGQAGPGQ